MGPYHSTASRRTFTRASAARKLPLFLASLALLSGCSLAPDDTTVRRPRTGPTAIGTLSALTSMHPARQAPCAGQFGTGMAVCEPGERGGRMSGDVRPLFLRGTWCAAAAATRRPAIEPTGADARRGVRNRGDPEFPAGCRQRSVRQRRNATLPVNGG